MANKLLSLADANGAKSGYGDLFDGLVRQHAKFDGGLSLFCLSKMRDAIAQSENREFCFQQHFHEFEMFPFFQEFLDYTVIYDTLRKNIGGRVALPDEVSPVALITAIVENEHVDTWASLNSALSCPQALDLVLQYSSALELGSKIFDIIADQSEATAVALFDEKIRHGLCDEAVIRSTLFKLSTYGKLALRLASSSFDYSESLPDMATPVRNPLVVSRYLAKNLEIAMGLGEVTGSCDFFDPETFDFDDRRFSEFLVNLVDQPKPRDFARFNNLYYQNPDLFLSVFSERLSQFSVAELSEVLPFATYQSLAFLADEHIDFIDVDLVLRKLLDSENFRGLFHFLHDFSVIAQGVEFLRHEMDRRRRVFRPIPEGCRELAADLQDSIKRRISSSLSHITLPLMTVDTPEFTALTAFFEADISMIDLVHFSRPGNEF
jgi:hypothetical protein